MSDPDQKIDYRYLNMVDERFEPSMVELLQAFRGLSGYQRAVINPGYGQVLYAMHTKPFSESAAVIMSRRISGVEADDE